MTTEAWSAKPFISKDGVDENGLRAEVQVKTGYGTIKEIIEANSGKAKQFVFNTGHPKGYVNKGWLNITEAKAVEELEEAFRTETPLYYRIETTRKNTVDRNLPFSEISGTMEKGRENLMHRLAGYGETESNINYTSSIVTNPAEDPNTSGGTPSAFTNPVPAEPTPRKSSSGVNAIGEAAPYMLYNSNGELNPGSLAVSVPFNIYTYISEYEKENEFFSLSSEEERWAMTRTLLLAANRMQIGVYDGSIQRPDLIAGSHTRARALLFELIRSGHPLSAELLTNAEKKSEWVKTIVAEGIEKWKTSIAIIKQLTS